jgi:putative aldouronate transport system permease protein
MQREGGVLMNNIVAINQDIKTKKLNFLQRNWKEIKKNKYLIFLMLPGMIYFLIFKYGPIYGVLLAFKDFDPSLGIMGSPWVGLRYFHRLFETAAIWRIVYNTLKISFLKIVFGFPAPIIFALLLNEISRDKFKRVVQTISYLPHFLSWVVVSGLIFQLLSPSYGLYGYICNLLEKQAIVLLGDNKAFITTIILSDIWKEVGYASVIYLAAIVGISTEQYEAAKIDGATKIQQMLYVTLPGIASTIAILFVLRLGSVLDAGFDQIINLYNPMVMNVADVIDTYVYRIGLTNFEYSFATAVGLTKSVVAFVLVMSSNWIVSKYTDTSIW